MRSRKLPPGPGKRQELVARNQRERLMGACVAAFPELGYRETRVADLLDLSGISRSTFYKHFADKDSCFIAALDAVLELAVQQLTDEQRSLGGPWQRRVEALLRTLAEMIVAQPSAARLALVEVHAAGPEAIDRLEHASGLVEGALADALQVSAAQAGLPRDLIKSFVGSVRMMALTRLREGREAELPGLVSPLVDWMLSYDAPSEPLRRPTEVPADATAQRPAIDDARRRILDAVPQLVALDGYKELTINDIVERAAMSLTTFYEHFDSAHAAFMATLADASERLLATTRAAYASADDWPQAINAAAHRFVGFMATDPAVARMGLVEAWATGAEGFELRAFGRARFHELLEPGFALNPDVPPIAAEAIGAAGDALLFDRLRRNGIAGLYEAVPTGVFLVLAPFIGSEAATAVANETASPRNT